jgi:PKD repeat protein
LYLTTVNETLGPGESRTINCSWDTTGEAGQHDFKSEAFSIVPGDDNFANDFIQRSLTILAGTGGRRPVASLQASPASAQVGQPVNFDGSGSFDPDGTVRAYDFTFGDGNSTGWIPDDAVIHSYASAGNYTAALRVRDNSSLVSGNEARVQVTVGLAPNRPPAADILSILPNPAAAGQAVTFAGEAHDDDGAVVGYLWTSSIDGDLSPEQSFTSANLSLGTHTMTFKAQDDRGAWSAAVSQSLEIRIPAVNQPPKATIISITPSPATTGDTVRLKGAGEDSDGTVVGYRWSSSLQGELGRRNPLTVANLTAGVHVISLTVEDDGGAWSPESTARLEVTASPPAGQPNRPPKASLSVPDPSVTVNVVVRLDGSGSADSDGQVEAYMFDFGDGTPACWTFSSSAEHVYTAAGQYVARLKVRDNGGAQSPWSGDVLIEVKARKQAPAPSGGLPGMETVLAVFATLAALVMAQARRKRAG